ncbi:MAG TPA: hypothetical protein VLM40_16420 [Gemmata sp.]|nr:hypothetical protein [Gemmata sp.]
MSEDPTPDVPVKGSPQSQPELPAAGGENPADLKSEVERLRTQLAKVTTEAEMYRRAAYSMLEQLVPYVPPTEEEFHNMMRGPRGRSILEIVNELEREGAG